MNEHQLFIARMRHLLTRTQEVGPQAVANILHTTVSDARVLAIHNAMKRDPLGFIQTCESKVLEEIVRYMKVLERDYLTTNEGNNEKV